MEIPQKNKPSHEFHLHCCLVLELDCLYNNTSFWLSLSTCEITYYLSTLSKRVRPLITLSFHHPKPTKGIDALSRWYRRAGGGGCAGGRGGSLGERGGEVSQQWCRRASGGVSGTVAV